MKSEPHNLPDQRLDITRSMLGGFEMVFAAETQGIRMCVRALCRQAATTESRNELAELFRKAASRARFFQRFIELFGPELAIRYRVLAGLIFRVWQLVPLASTLTESKTRHEERARLLEAQLKTERDELDETETHLNYVNGVLRAHKKASTNEQ